ncbi:hypothetical protein [Rahnella victoriana]|uniref:hypothetical protein n=1 Tax=Rahnella victoriana TaxID=1510570 RepID=UPI000BB19361|nr:hypothetical protein [Rahnella victoriana]PBI79032.1 hypothetical protein A9993_04525 [Rahnella victoriana]TBX36992.1 hypothetical protein EYY67_02370 [Rahnella victoriana]
MYVFLANNIIIDHFRFKIIQLIKTLEVSDIPTDKKSKLEMIKNKVFFESPSLNDLCYAEKDLIEMCTEEQLDVLYREERCRYARILPEESKNNLRYLDEYVGRHAGPGKFDRNNASRLTKEKSKRSKLLCVCGWIHEYYYFLIEKERFIGKVKRDLCTLLIILICLSLLYYAFFSAAEKSANSFYQSVSLIMGMASAGYFGAVVSTVRRFQNMAIISADGIDRESFLLKLQQGMWGIYLSVILGATSPFVLFLFLNIISAGGHLNIMGVEFLPQFDKPVPPCALKSICSEGSGLFHSDRLAGPLDVAKVIFFSVICGFSERLVPDVLDRMKTEVTAGSLLKKPDTHKEVKTNRPS